MRRRVKFTTRILTNVLSNILKHPVADHSGVAGTDGRIYLGGDV
jgi:hypothetical protein